MGPPPGLKFLVEKLDGIEFVIGDQDDFLYGSSVTVTGGKVVQR